MNDNNNLVSIVQIPDLSNVTLNKKELSNTSVGESDIVSIYNINTNRSKFINSLIEYLKFDDSLELDEMTLSTFYEIVERVSTNFDEIFDETSISVTDNGTILFEAHHDENFIGIEFAKYEFTSFFKLNGKYGGTSNSALDIVIINSELIKYSNGIFR